MSDLGLIIWDVDGTLVDSQATIIAAMSQAFDAVGLAVPTDRDIRSIVGLSLERGFERLLPAADQHAISALADAYRRAYFERRERLGTPGTSPFYPGIRPLLDRLHAMDRVLMAIATGKSRRGVDLLVQGHGLEGYFICRETADTHPSKPHPSMILDILDQTGLSPEAAVMVGDTSFDMDMARAAGVRSIGVTWGYHRRDDLMADQIVEDIPDLTQALMTFLEAK